MADFRQMNKPLLNQKDSEIKNQLEKAEKQQKSAENIIRNDIAIQTQMVEAPEHKNCNFLPFC